MNYYGVKFYIHPKKNLDGTLLIYLFYRKNGLKVKYYLKSKIYEEFKGYLSDNREPPYGLQEEVSKKYRVFKFTLKDMVKNVVNEMLQIAEIVKKYEFENYRNPDMWTNHKLRSLLDENHRKTGAEITAKTKFYEFCETVEDEMESGDILTPDGRKYQKSTIKKFKQFKNLFVTYQTNSKRKYALADINNSLIKKFLDELEKEGMSPETVTKHKKSFLRIIKIAISKGMLSENITKGFAYSGRSYKKEELVLNEDEISKIIGLELLDNPSLQKARDIFIVACYTAQSYSDIVSIRREDIKKDETDGRYYWSIYRKKTHNHIYLLLKPLVVEILERRDFKMDLLSSQQVNKKIKILGKMAGLTEEISLRNSKGEYITKKKCDFIVTHTGRRTFLTNLYMSGVPLDNIREIANHSSIQTTMGYLHINETQRRERMKEVDMLN
jgi:integrase